MKGKFLKRVFVTLFVYCVPALTAAQVWITEINYNPDGSDTGREWIEVFNGSDEAVDVTDFKFREGDVNHKITTSGEHRLEPGEYAVVADKSEVFRIEHASYEGLIFDSAFSLKNSSEKLEIINPQGLVVFEVTYNSSTGGNNNGHTIGLLGDIWKETLYSPGVKNTEVQSVFVPEHENTDSEEVINEETKDSQREEPSDLIQNPTTPAVDVPATYIEIKNPEYKTKLIKVDAGGDRTVMAGVSYWFTGEVYGLEGGLLDKPSVRWNWGDGSWGQGTSEQHRYLYPGTYTAVMSAVSGKYSARDIVTITVIPPALEISEIDITERLITLTNTSRFTLEISGYILKHGEATFVIPDDTFIAARNSIVFDPNTHALLQNTNGQIILSDGEKHILSAVDIKQSLEAQLRKQVEKMDTAPVVAATSTAMTVTGAVFVENKRVVSDTLPSTHSVVYLETRATNEDEYEDLDFALVKSAHAVTPNQGAQVITSINKPQTFRYWVDVLLLVGIVMVGVGGYVVYYLREKRRLESGFELVE